MNRVAGWLGVLLVGSGAVAADWPQFRGPGGSSVADKETPPLVWSETQNIRWTVALPGRGLSSPVIVGDRLYLTACSGYRERRLHVLCFDPATGKKLWERQQTATGSTQCHPKTNMAAPTPVADVEGVVALFATGDLIALNPDGDLLWLRSLVGDYPDITNQVGMASSPALTKEAVIVPMDSAGESFLAAVSRKDGRNLWKTPRPRDINWTTPLLLDGADGRRIVFQSEKGLDCYTLADGKAAWSLPLKKSSSMASPVAVGVHQGDVIVLADELLRLKESATSGQPPEIVWKSGRPAAGYPSPVVYRDGVYTLTSNGILRKADLNMGTEVWRERFKGPFAATPVAAAGKLYLFNEKGTGFVVDVTQTPPKTLATNILTVADKDEVLGTPALANGAIYLRTDRRLVCIGSPQ